MKQPAVEAANAIIEVMIVGSRKDGCDESWRSKPVYYHLGKGIRHATTALMIQLGVADSDDEDHLKLAVTRMAMAMCVVKN